MWSGRAGRPRTPPRPSTPLSTPWTGSGTPLHGGLPSGHAALAFGAWIAATYVAGQHHRFLVSTIAFVMALLVAQTRVESGIHSALEVTYGGVLGALVTLAVFQLFA